MGVLDGVRVVDLSRGVAGPLSTMLMADHGAAVTMVEPPGGAPFVAPAGSRTWRRGKRSAVLDLTADRDRGVLRGLLAGADVLVEDFTPATAASLGLNPSDVSETFPRLVHCSITGYGPDGADAERPGYDLLVSARAGAGWTDNDEAGCAGLGPRRPVASAASMCGMMTGYLATLGVVSALFSRERSGRGQHVGTSVMQGLLHLYGYRWLRPETEGSLTYSGGMLGTANNSGIYEAADGWLCNWPGTPEWAIAAAKGDQLRRPAEKDFVAHRSGKPRVLSTAERLAIIEQARNAFRRFPVADWVALGAELGIGVQPVRPPGVAFSDPALLDEGVIVEAPNDRGEPERRAGIVYRLAKRPAVPNTHVAAVGADTDVVRASAEAANDNQSATDLRAVPDGGPLAGVRVLDLGLAVAGPWSTQLLADLGADVIKIDPQSQAAWIAGPMGAAVNAGKRSLGLDLKHEDGAAALRRLVESADVVTLNMRPNAAERLGLDEASLRRINERIIYCHTRGFEDGPRSQLPGTDQTCNALGGGLYEAGGVASGGRPYFGAAAGGDLGTGSLAAIAIVKALYDRQRTGTAQSVDTSILNAVVMNNSRVAVRADGSELPRPMLDAAMQGHSATYGIYRCRQGWLAIAVVNDRHWAALSSTITVLQNDDRFATAADREQNDADLRKTLAAHLMEQPADTWVAVLSAAAVPCERYEENSPASVFDDPDLLRRGWVLDRPGNERTGPVRMFGPGVSFSATPVLVHRGPPSLGQHSEEVLLDCGFDQAEIDALVDSGAVITSA